MKKSLFAVLTLALLCVANVANAQSSNKPSTPRQMMAQAKAEGYNGMEARAQKTKPEKIRNDSATGTVEVTLDRKDLTYCEGDEAKIFVRSSVDGYLYLISFDCNDNPTLLFPNDWNRDNRISANAQTTYPAADQDFILAICGPNFGKEKIRAYVTREEIKELKGIKYGKDVTDISGVIGKFQKALQERVAVDYESAKPIRVKARPAADEYELTIGECVYYTQKGTSTQSPAKAARRIFIGFGIDLYKDKNIRSLRCCAKDAKAMGKIAVERLGVSTENCIVLTNEEVTLEKVSYIFNNVLPEFTRPGDQVFIYWSGHGDKLASGTTRENDCFLVPYDANVNDPRTMLNEHAFGNWLKDNLQGREIVLILDACHSGGMLLGGGKSLGGAKGQSLADMINGGSNSKSLSEGFVFDFGLETVEKGAKSLGHVGMFAMASSSESQLSWEGSGSVGLSVATHYLIETLKQGDASLTHKDLVGKIRPKVSAYVKKNRPNSDQTVVANDQLEPALKLIAK